MKSRTYNIILLMKNEENYDHHILFKQLINIAHIVCIKISTAQKILAKLSV